MGNASKAGNLREHPSAALKGSQPRFAALGSPFQGKGLAWTLPPSYGRRCPEGAEVGWGKRYEKERGEIVSSAPLTRAPYPPLTRSPFPNGEGKEEVASPPKKESQPRLAALGSPFQGKGLAWTTPSFLWKEVPRRGGGWMGGSGIPDQCLPRVGKVASEASRIGF